MSQKAAGTVITRYGLTNWFKIGKGVHQGCILSLCLTYMQSTSYEMLDESQTGIKIAGIKINNLRYANDNSVMEKVKRNERVS